MFDSVLLNCLSLTIIFTEPTLAELDQHSRSHLPDMKLSTPRSLLLSALAATLALPLQTSAWYLPGSAPHSYKQGDDVPFSVNALQAKAFTSQIKGVIKYDYYDPHFQFCTPEGGPEAQSENLGSVLFGDRIYSSPVKGVMLKDEVCKEMCRTTIKPENAMFVNDRIREEYAVNWMVDGLPVAESRREVKTREEFLSLGFALGSLEDEYNRPYDPPALHNHYDIYIDYHKRGPDEYRVVGARIYPSPRIRSRVFLLVKAPIAKRLAHSSSATQRRMVSLTPTASTGKSLPLPGHTVGRLPQSL